MMDSIFRSYKRTPENNRDRIWLNYKIFKQQAYIIRSGFGLSGIYDFQDSIIKPDVEKLTRPESDLEHVAGLMNLIRAVSWYYPEIVPKEQLDDFLFGATIHEIGELKLGDLPDDGTRNEVQKTFSETLIIGKYLYDTAPLEEYKRGMSIFEQMNSELSDLGATLHFLDKLEAVLQTLFYESMGHPGLLHYKAEHFGSISARDKEGIEKTGSDNIADVWAYNFLRKGIENDYRYTDTLFSIILAASEDVRGEPFSWIRIQK